MNCTGCERYEIVADGSSTSSHPHRSTPTADKQCRVSTTAHQGHTWDHIAHARHHNHNASTHVGILGLGDGHPRVGVLGVPDDVVALGGQAEGVCRSEGRGQTNGGKEGDQLHVVV